MEEINKIYQKVLPYGTPVVKTWPEDCFLFSLLANTENGNKWISDSNIQILNTHDIMMYYPLRRQHFFKNGFDENPFIEKYNIDRKLLYMLEKNFGEVIRTAINEGFYIGGLFNRRILLENIKGDLNHVCYIYGYDIKEDVVYMNENFYHGINSCQRIPFERVQKAFEVALSSKAMLLGNRVISFYKLNPGIDYQLSKEKIKAGLLDYLNGTCEGQDKNNEYTFFGIRAYEALCNTIENAVNSEIDLRNISFLCDIANVNRLRVEILIKSGLFEEDIRCLFQKIERQIGITKVMLGLSIKYNAKKDEKILHRLGEMIRKFEQDEEDIAKYIVGLC